MKAVSMAHSHHLQESFQLAVYFAEVVGACQEGWQAEWGGMQRRYLLSLPKLCEIAVFRKSRGLQLQASQAGLLLGQRGLALLNALGLFDCRLCLFPLFAFAAVLLVVHCIRATRRCQRHRPACAQRFRQDAGCLFACSWPAARFSTNSPCLKHV